MNIAISRQYVDHSSINAKGRLLHPVPQLKDPVRFSCLLIKAIEEWGVPRSDI